MKVMNKNNNRCREMEQLISQFNRITGNTKPAVSMKYLIHFKWNIIDAAEAYLSLNEYIKSPLSVRHIQNNCSENNKNKISTRHTERSSDPKNRYSMIPKYYQEEKPLKIKRRKSNNIIDDIIKNPAPKEEMHIPLRKNTFKMPCKILKPKIIHSTNVSKINEVSPFDHNDNIHELETRGSSNLSSEKDIPELEAHNEHGGMFDLSPEIVTFRGTARFGFQEK